MDKQTETRGQPWKYSDYGCGYPAQDWTGSEQLLLALVALQIGAEELRQVLTLEISGKRDGDGYWHGSDVVSARMQDVQQLIARVREATRVLDSR